MANKELAKRSTMDRLAALAGAGAGVAGASAVGTAIGGAGLLGSIGSAVGLTVAVATPVGWLVGGAALGAAALYGGSKIVGAKGVSDGDAKAHRQFNSDIEKKLYMQLTTKLSQKDSKTAKTLLNRIPSDYNDWKNDMNDGLDKGTASATEIISTCCELLGEDSSQYLDDNNFSTTEIELTIKIAILMALADGDFTDDEGILIRNKVVGFFELSNVLDESEIDLIFSQARGTEEQQEQLKAMSFEEIQSLFVVFFLTIENTRLKTMLIDFLAEIAEADGEISEKEVQLYNIFIGLLNAEASIENYTSHLENLTKVKSDFLYSHQGSDSEAYAKKVKNALGSYAKGINNGMVMSLYDATVFGKADNGFIVTPLAIITDQSEDTRVIPLGSIYGAGLSENGDLLFYGEPDENNNMHAIAELSCPAEELSEFVTFIEKIIEINNNYEEVGGEAILDDTQEWHLAQNGNQLGLHSLQDIDSKFKTDDLSSDGLLVWKDGMAEWLPATEIEEINAIIEKYKVATPPPLPSTPPPLPS
ncbi:MAG: GYF domain-containing protein [Campylobacterota bacterium]|nr:GYF domain-containing protein [Campylobacterota bacterium]